MNGDWSLLRLMINRAFGKTNEVRETGDTSQARFEVIEIIEAFILALVAVATAWSGYQAAEWAGKRAEEYAKAVGSELLLKALLPWQDRSGSTTAIPLTVGSPRSWTVRKKPRSSSSGAFETSTDRHSQPGWPPIPSRTRKRLRARSSCPITTTPSTSSS